MQRAAREFFGKGPGTPRGGISGRELAGISQMSVDLVIRDLARLAWRVKAAAAANIDETGWREGGFKAWLWVVATSLGVGIR
jgi:hypothetical protein